jgi:hypothetical protein
MAGLVPAIWRQWPKVAGPSPAMTTELEENQCV